MKVKRYIIELPSIKIAEGIRDYLTTIVDQGDNNNIVLWNARGQIYRKNIYVYFYDRNNAISYHFTFNPNFTGRSMPVDYCALKIKIKKRKGQPNEILFVESPREVS